MHALPNRSTFTKGLSSLQAQTPQDALEAFEQSDYGGVWPHLSKTTLLDELRSRLHHPAAVMASSEPLSGPATLLFELIRHNPFRYIRLCHSVFETGGFQTSYHRVQASERLRHSSPAQEIMGQQAMDQQTMGQQTVNPQDMGQQTMGQQTMGQLDWMLVATLTEAQQSLFPRPIWTLKMIRASTQITQPWQLAGWVRDVFEYPRVAYHHAYLWPDLYLLRRAERAIAYNGIAIALMNLTTLFPHQPQQSSPISSNSPLSESQRPDAATQTAAVSRSMPHPNPSIDSTTGSLPSPQQPFLPPLPQWVALMDIFSPALMALSHCSRKEGQNIGLRVFTGRQTMTVQVARRALRQGMCGVVIGEA